MVGIGVALALVAFAFYIQEIARVWRDKEREPARFEWIVGSALVMGLGVWLATF